MSGEVADTAADRRPPRKRGRVSFASDDFTEGTSLRTLPDSGPTQRRIPLDQLAHNPRNPRYGYDDPDTAELATSLREHGQLQPATVVARDVYLAHHPEDASQVGTAPWVVLIGNRRLAAARQAGLAHLAAIAEDRLGGTDPMLSEATLVENIHRQDLPPLLEAIELQGLLERHGSQTKVAQRVAKTQAWVSQRLTLLKLIPELREQLKQGELTVKEARKVATLPPEQQEQGLAQMREDRTLSRTQTEPGEGLPDSTSSGSARNTESSNEPTSPDIDRMAKRLRRQLEDDQLAALIEALTALRN